MGGTALVELSLADWRRQAAGIYSDVRGCGEPMPGSCAMARRARPAIPGTPAKPARPADPLRASGLPYWPYDPRLRFAVPLVPEPHAAAYEVPTAPGELTRIRQIGWVELPDPVGERLPCGGSSSTAVVSFCRSAMRPREARPTAPGATCSTRPRVLTSAWNVTCLVLDFNFSLPPVVSLRPGLAMPACAAAKRAERGDRGGGAALLSVSSATHHSESRA